MDVTSATRRQIPVTGTPEQLMQDILGRLVGIIEGDVKGFNHDAHEAIEKLAKLGQTEALKICLLNPKVEDLFKSAIVKQLVQLKDLTAVEPIVQYLLEVRSEDKLDTYLRLDTVSQALSKLDIPQVAKGQVAQILEAFYWKFDFDYKYASDTVRQRIEQLKGGKMISPFLERREVVQRQLDESLRARVKF